MSIDLAIWSVGAAIACIFLLKMMHSKQAKLSELLREYLSKKVAWAKKRAKAVKLARQKAAEQATNEKSADMVIQQMVAADSEKERAA